MIINFKTTTVCFLCILFAVVFMTAFDPRRRPRVRKIENIAYQQYVLCALQCVRQYIILAERVFKMFPYQFRADEMLYVSLPHQKLMLQAHAHKLVRYKLVTYYTLFIGYPLRLCGNNLFYYLYRCLKCIIGI